MGGRSPSSIFHFLSSPDYWLVLLLLALGLMSRSMLVTLPFVLLLLDYWPLGRFQLSAFNFQLFKEKVPFFGLALAAGLLTVHAEKEAGALGNAAIFPIQVRAANAALSSVYYLWQTVWPTKLAVFYPYPTSFPTGLVVGLLLLLVLISVVVIRMRRRHPYLAVGWFWYLITLVPVSGLIQIGDHARADRYTYVPLTGIFLMASWGAVALCGARRHGRVVLRVTTGAALVGLLALAHGQTAYWRDSISLWTHTLACTPENPQAHNNFGLALAAQGRTDEAIPHYEQALRLAPNNTVILANLGNALLAQGKLDAAIQQYEQALRLQPDYAAAHINLGNALVAQGKPSEAIQQYERALQLQPDHAEARINLGNALVAQGKVEAGIRQFEQALALKPDQPEAHFNLGNALAAEGKLDAAIEHFSRAVQLKPAYAEAHYTLGGALAGQGKFPAAIEQFQQALNLATSQGNPALVEASRNQLKLYQPAMTPSLSP